MKSRRQPTKHWTQVGGAEKHDLKELRKPSKLACTTEKQFEDGGMHEGANELARELV